MRAIPPEAVALTPAVETDKPIGVKINGEESNLIRVRVYFQINDDTAAARNYAEALAAAGISITIRLKWTRKGDVSLSKMFQKNPPKTTERNFANLGSGLECSLRYPKACAETPISWYLKVTARLQYDGGQKMNINKSGVSTTTSSYQQIWEQLELTEALEKKMTLKHKIDMRKIKWVNRTKKRRLDDDPLSDDDNMDWQPTPGSLTIRPLAISKPADNVVKGKLADSILISRSIRKWNSTVGKNCKIDDRAPNQRLCPPLLTSR
jgi:hypothetical protein